MTVTPRDAALSMMAAALASSAYPEWEILLRALDDVIASKEVPETIRASAYAAHVLIRLASDEEALLGDEGAAAAAVLVATVIDPWSEATRAPL